MENCDFKIGTVINLGDLFKLLDLKVENLAANNIWAMIYEYTVRRYTTP